MKLGMQLRIDAEVDTYWALRCVQEFLRQGLDKNTRNVCLFADTEGGVLHLLHRENPYCARQLPAQLVI
jgi:hypothetical protein